jgi:hypothetical protein
MDTSEKEVAGFLKLVLYRYRAYTVNTSLYVKAPHVTSGLIPLYPLKLVKPFNPKMKNFP